MILDIFAVLFFGFIIAIANVVAINVCDDKYSDLDNDDKNSKRLIYLTLLNAFILSIFEYLL